MRYIYLSAFCADRTPEQNQAAHRQLLQILDGQYVHRVVQGCYRGTRELTVQVQVNYGVDGLLTLARDFGQESVLYVDEEADAWLVYPALTDGRGYSYVSLGTWQLTDRRTAIYGGNYTKIGEDYYTCAPPAADRRITG